MITLRPHQVKAEDNARRDFVIDKHLIVCLGCGAGKSYVFTSMVYKAVNNGVKCLILSHRIKILRQNNESLGDFGLSPIVINDQTRDEFDKDQLLYASSAQTIKSRFDILRDWVSGFGLIIIDECHLQYYNFLFEDGCIDDTFVVGLSGTPYRMGNQRQLGIDYGVISTSVTQSQLIELGYVLPTRIFEIPIDVSTIEKSNGEFKSKSAFQKYDTPETYSGLLNAYKKHGEDGIFIGFCTTILHCIKTCIAFCDAGYESRFVVSGVSKPNKPDESDKTEMEKYKDRLATHAALSAHSHLWVDSDEAKDMMLSGDILGIFSIEKLSVGFDYQPISVCLMNRATTSVGLWIQMAARATRVMDKPQFSHLPKKHYGIIIDMGDNRRRLGDLDTDRVWSLWHETSDSVGLPSLKKCPKCNADILSSYKICPMRKCGYRFPTKSEVKEAELTEYLRDAGLIREMNPRQLLAYAELHKYKKAWAFRQLWNRGDEQVFIQDMRTLGYKSGYIYNLIGRYKK